MFSITTTIILILSCIGTSVASGQFRGGHGSHQHMKNSHQHHVPQRQESGPVQSVLQDKKLIHDHEHLKEDLKDVYTEEEIFKMTTDEIEFHYFKLHDYDDNNLLDGIEIMAAISHIVPHDPDLDLGRQPEGNVLTAEQQLRLKAAQQSKADQIEHFTRMIDKMIQDSDNDKDGFVNYQEYKRVRRPDGV
ncbi:multiple coagulation factor deficiency protein 2 homolog isoform X1 [Daphnia pulicaria]|uniref:multiple coagulation factor deficiency protein 2 homolog isoform X1 n=1 Tax=Daphnia pulicaria TaxID=35523 RepID=UPI001EEAC464|nr:multiple coagulation factor deficiency protein 2 homolog isoform X1 [Daphnia pulicaria]